MKVLLIHNYYRSVNPSGENASFEAEHALLVRYGHEVRCYTRRSDEIVSDGIGNKVRLARDTVWSGRAYRELEGLLAGFRPDVAHFQNTFPLISASAYMACKRARVPVVQTLRNFRLVCANGLLYRDEAVCERCMGAVLAWPGIVRGCYRGSSLQTAVVGASAAMHLAMGRWMQAVGAYNVLTEFARSKYIQAGVPAGKIHVRGNFLARNPQPRAGLGRYAVFVGRFSQEKGLPVLLSAWRMLRYEVPLLLAGDGPLSDMVREAAAAHPNIQLLGRVSQDALDDLIGNAAFLVIPSQCYEGLPRTIIEAFAVGTPVVCSGFGGMSSVVEHRRTGVHFKPGDPADLASAVSQLLAHPEELACIRKAARAEFEAKFTAEKGHQSLLQIYRAVLNNPRAM